MQNKMKNSERKDFYQRVEKDQVVTIKYNGDQWTFKNNSEASRKSLHSMCEFMYDDDLQQFWEGQSDLTDANWKVQDKEEKRLINMCEIIMHKKKIN